MTTKPLIYIVDDEQDICELVCDELEKFGFATDFFLTGKEAQRAIQRKQPALCIVDLGLPDMDGLALLKELYDTRQMGVIILSGRNSLPDKVLGLELGADDYISKPFDPRELVARVKSIIRRLQQSSALSTGRKTATFSEWVYDPATLTLTHCNGDKVTLSTAEAEILHRFLKSPQQILSRDQLLSDHALPFDRSIDVRLSRLRKKLEADHKNPKIIKTVYGSGYIFAAGVEWQ